MGLSPSSSTSRSKPIRSGSRLRFHVSRITDQPPQRQAAAKVTDYTPFWIFNGLAVTGDMEAMLALAAWPEVAEIRPNRVHHLPHPAKEAERPEVEAPNGTSPTSEPMRSGRGSASPARASLSPPWTAAWKAPSAPALPPPPSEWRSRSSTTAAAARSSSLSSPPTTAA